MKCFTVWSAVCPVFIISCVYGWTKYPAQVRRGQNVVMNEKKMKSNLRYTLVSVLVEQCRVSLYMYYCTWSKLDLAPAV